MKHAFFEGVLFILFISTTAFLPSPRSPIEGTWMGEFKNGATILTIQVHFWTEDGETKGTIDIPQESVVRVPLEWIIVDSTSVHFELVRDNGTRVFEGELKNGRIVGDYLTSGNRGSFYLISATAAI